MADPSIDIPNVTAPKGKGKGKKKLPKIVIIVPIVIALLAVFFLVGPGKALIGGDKKGAKKVEVKKEAPAEMSHPAVDIGEFVLNLKTEPGAEPRYVKVGIAVSIEGEGGGHGKSPIEGKEAFLKDVIIERFSTATVAELNDPAGRAKIKKELEEEFASMMPKEIKVHGVYFTQLAFQ